MSHRSSNGNLALIYAHSYTHYSILIVTARNCNYGVTDDCVSNQEQFDAVRTTSFISFNQMQVQLFHGHDAFISLL